MFLKLKQQTSSQRRSNTVPRDNHSCSSARWWGPGATQCQGEATAGLVPDGEGQAPDGSPQLYSGLSTFLRERYYLVAVITANGWNLRPFISILRFRYQNNIILSESDCNCLFVQYGEEYSWGLAFYMCMCKHTHTHKIKWGNPIQNFCSISQDTSWRQLLNPDSLLRRRSRQSSPNTRVWAQTLQRAANVRFYSGKSS